MKKLILIVLLSSPAYASGPKYIGQSPPLTPGTTTQMGTTQSQWAALYSEFVNVYNDIKNIAATGIVGTMTNDSANAGRIGEWIKASNNGVYVNSPGNTAYGDLDSISLTAGDWDVSGVVDWTLNGATMASSRAGISTTSGNSGSGLVEGENFVLGPPPVSTYGITEAIPCYRVSLSATTTVYLKYFAAYSAGTPQATGRISARRMR